MGAVVMKTTMHSKFLDVDSMVTGDDAVVYHTK